MNNVYISFTVPQLEDKIHELVNNEGVDASHVRIVAQSYAAQIELLTGWALNHGGQVILRELSNGIIAMPADKVDQELKLILNRFDQETGMTMQAGVGICIADSQKALDYVLQTESQDFKYYDPAMIKELEERDDPVDWTSIEGVHTPMKEDDKNILDEPFGDIQKSVVGFPTLHKADDGSPETKGDNAPKKPDEQKQPGDDQEIDPLELLKDVVNEIAKYQDQIQQLQAMQPELYNLFVDILRGIKGAAIALKPPQEEGGASPDAVSLGEVKGDEQAGDDALPVGTVHKGRVKTKLPDGTTKWVSVRSGQVAGGISAKAVTDYSGGNNNYQGGGEELEEGAPQEG